MIGAARAKATGAASVKPGDGDDDALPTDQEGEEEEMDFENDPEQTGSLNSEWSWFAHEWNYSISLQKKIHQLLINPT